MGVTTGVLAILGLLGLLAVFGIFVVLTEDPLAALALYVPFLATTLLTPVYIGDERINLATLFGVVPIRVLGPFVLGWLCARQLRKGTDTARVALFAGAGLVAVNNTEYGATSVVAWRLPFGAATGAGARAGFVLVGSWVRRAPVPRSPSSATAR